jgi:hypothetical protein
MTTKTIGNDGTIVYRSITKRTKKDGSTCDQEHVSYYKPRKKPDGWISKGNKKRKMLDERLALKRMVQDLDDVSVIRYIMDIISDKTLARAWDESTAIVCKL